MRICTITCHDVYNYGASLQAYALMRYLEGIGHQVEIIDYKPDYLSGHYRLFTADSPLVGDSGVRAALYILLKLPGRLLSRRRKLAFDRFREKYLKITAVRYNSYLDLCRNPPQADCFFAGSDQIWNTSRPNGRDPAFYLMFVPEGAVKASYAASVATDTIAKDARAQVQAAISALHYVSVRETTAVSLLEGLGVEDVTHVLDPVFLIPKQDWDGLASVGHDQEYVLVYDFESSEEVRRVATEYAAMHRLKIYSIGAGRCDYSDKRFPYAGPSEFISLIREARFVVTNSYHATVFCLLYGIDLYVSGRSESINSRMEDLLALFGLTIQSHINVRAMEEDIRKAIDKKLLVSKKFIDRCLSAAS